jgi:alpha-tubulin suppressor-like RCC1 family protein
MLTRFLFSRPELQETPLDAYFKKALTCTLLACLSAAAAFAGTTLSASQNHALALQGTGTVCAAGQNDDGELGDGTAADQHSPVTSPVLTGITAVSSGWYHGLALKTGGTVWSWGYGADGELGNGGTNVQPTPMPVPGLTGMIAVAAGSRHSVAVKSDGTVWAWGTNSNGQLGDGTASQRLSPVQTITITGVIAVAAGQLHTLALKSDGTVWAWGYNGYGELGDGTTTQRLSPVQVTGLTGVIAIAAGTIHSMALKSDGTVWTWGYNGNGELGNGSTTQANTIVTASGLTGVVSIAAGDSHSLAAKSDGTVWTWGYNANGQLGIGSMLQKTTPTQVSGFTGATAVGGGLKHSVALKSDGTMWAWGDNSNGQLGTGTTNNTLLPVASLPCASGTFEGGWKSSFTSRLTANQNHSLALKSDGTVFGWGQNDSGELGDGTAANIRTTPVQAAGLTSMAVVSTGWYHSIGLKTDGTVWTWGYNGEGELGNGGTSQQPTPLQVSSLTGVVAVSAGARHSVVVKSDGTVWAWGQNSNGQLGDGTTGQRLSPVQAISIANVIAVAAGEFHTLALKSDGTVWAWGYNGYGELGDGTTTQRSSAVQVLGLTGVIAISAGSIHSLALKADGTVWAWGYDGNGELGDGGTTSAPEIVRVVGLVDVISISAGDSHSLAAKSDGTAWAWGYNNGGQLGIGNTIQQVIPQQVTGLTGILAVAAGLTHSNALKDDGTIWSWGDNTYGQFAEPTPASSTVPLQATTWYVTTAGGVALTFYPLAPCRVADTRTTQSFTGAFGPPALEPYLTRDFPILSSNCNIPVTAQAYSLNITAVPTGPLGFLSTWPVGQSYPGVSTLNSTDGSVIANAAIVPAGTNGDINVVVGNPTDVIIDVNGYFAPPGASGLEFFPLTPCRIADTRSTQPFTGAFGPPSLSAYVTRDFPIATSPCITGSEQAYSLNMTVVPPGPEGFLSVWPVGQSYPGVSTLNSPDGTVIANAAIVPAGTGGDIDVVVGNPTDVVIDINGKFAAPATGGLHFYSVTPCRIADTRTGQGFSGQFGPPSLAAYVNRNFPIQSSSCGIPVTAAAYALNMTVVPQGPLGFLSTWPAGQSYPGVSTLNSPNGTVIANAAIVPAGTSGAITVVVGNPTDLIIDIVGYFAP